jgi:hypothetical protein
MIEILYTHIWKEKNYTCWNYSKKRGGGKRRMMEEVNLAKIYYKHFYKSDSVPPVQQ